mgnify:CR=1 FL=1
MIIYIDEHGNKVNAEEISSETYKMTLLGFVDKSGVRRDKLDFPVDELDYALYRAIKMPEDAVLERRKHYLRQKRKSLLEAFDKWEKAVLRGREKDDTSIMSWYKNLLNLVENAFETENIPDRIKYYLK